MGDVAVGKEDFWLVSTLARVYFQRRVLPVPVFLAGTTRPVMSLNVLQAILVSAFVM